MTTEFFTPDADKLRLAETRAEGDAGLPRVLIIGDSISIGYTPAVRRRLSGIAVVHRPDANCGDTRAGLAHLAAWLGDGRWDVIHFNFGLHDLCYRHPASKEYGNRDKLRGRQSVQPEAYRENLVKIVDRLRLTGATLIWASTTVVPDGEAGRFAEDAGKYNAIASGIMEAACIRTNDLYAFTGNLPPTAFVAPGDVHYTPEASDALGGKVAEAIIAALARPEKKDSAAGASHRQS